ncbi:hypothetical protein Tco_0195547 [Tanacetum coccineum]
MLRLQSLGNNTKTGVPYTEEEIMAIVQKGKQRGHLPDVGMVKMMMRLFRSDDKFSQMLDQFQSSPEFGGASGSGGCEDDEPGGDEDEEGEEDGDKEKVDTSKALDASLVNTESSGTKFEKQDTSSRSGNDADADNSDIKPVYDKEPMAEVQLTAECNVFAIGQQHSEQPKFNNKGEVDHNVEQCHGIRHLPAKLTDNQIIELSNQSLESENICLKRSLPRQHGQFLKAKSNEAKVKKDIDDFETINIELEYSVATLLKENEYLKKTYKDLFDSIKKKRVQTKDQYDSLIEQLNKKSIENADLKAQIQEKVFAITALKNELRKLKGTSVDTKFAKPSILGKPILHPLRNQSVVRQPTAFKSEQPRISKPRFASQVDVNNDLSKPVTPHYLPKVQESAFPLFEEYFTARNQSVSKSSALSDNSKQQDTQPTSNIQHTTEPKTPTANVNVEENNTDQAADA